MAQRIRFATPEWVAEQVDNEVAAAVTAEGLLTEAQASATYALVDPAMKLAPWRAALANRDAAPAVVACIGDSVTEHAYVTAHDRTWSKRMAASLRARFGVEGGAGFISPRVQGGTPLFTWPAVEASTVGNTAGGPKRILRGLQTTGSVTYTVTGTSVDVLWNSPASGSHAFEIVVDGGAPTWVDASGGQGRGKKTRVTLGTSGPHTVVVRGDVGNAFHTGIVVYDGDEDAGIHVHECGNFGTTAAAWISGVSNPADAWPADFASLAADLVFIALGFNDRNANTPPATYEANLRTLIGYVRATAIKPFSIVLHALYTPGSAATYPWQDYIDRMHTIADGDDRIAVLDQSWRMPTAAAGDDLALFYDSLHPRDRGAAMVGDNAAALLAPRT